MDGNTILAIHDMPTLTLQRGKRAKREINIQALVQILAIARPYHVFVEQIWGRPHTAEGGFAGAPLMMAYGIVLGVVGALGIPCTRVPPQRWKRQMVVPAGKDAARARASELLPAGAHLWPLKKHDGRAEAALICAYGWRTIVERALGA